MKKQILSFTLGLFVMAGAGFTAHEYQVRKNTAEADQSNGLYVFHESRPVTEYDVLGRVSVGAVVMSARYEPSREALLKKAKKEYPNADAIIIEQNAFKADVIKFK